MNDRQQNLDKFQLSLYFMPFIGAIWAWVKLASKSHLEPEERKISRLSLKIGLGWLVAYSSLWLGGNLASDLWAVRLLYMNTILTTTYFITCFILVSRLWSKNIDRKTGFSA